jgi:hypothetical protein
MKKIFYYNDFVNEKYEEAPEHRIKVFFTELEKNIRQWFSDGVFATNNTVLIDVKRALTNSMEKNLIFDFNDDEHYYQVYVIMSLPDVEEDELDECFIKVKKYDKNEMTLLRSLGEDVKIKELNEDTIIGLFSRLDDESGTLNLETGDVVLDDEDTDLENTNIK